MFEGAVALAGSGRRETGDQRHLLAITGTPSSEPASGCATVTGGSTEPITRISGDGAEIRRHLSVEQQAPIRECYRTR
jgi:hypothetical protein